MNKYNILILSAGRRVELLNLFKEAAKKLNINSDVIAGDLSPLAPALYFADKHILFPRIDSGEYISEIIKHSNIHNIKLIIPTIDTELLILSKNKEKIENETSARVLISEIEIIEICRDKIRTQEFIEKNNFLMPRMYETQEINEKSTYPLFIKPLDGSSSRNIFKVNNFNEFEVYSSIVKKPIIQDFMEGEEYTVDVFLDFNSKVITVAPRLRISVRDGEISQGKIIKNAEIIREVRKLMEVLKPIGHITVQLMKTKRGIEFIEVNPRFGGGAPMTIMSGANSCENLFKLLKGEELEYNENYTEDIYSRFDQSIRVKLND